MSQELCPECGADAIYLAECPDCGADVRARCEDCGLPFSGEGDLCKCGTFTDEERARFYRNSPPQSANRNNGGRGHGWLKKRRYNRMAA